MGGNKLYGTDEGGYEESGNWNVAEPFAIQMIMNPLRQFSEYSTMAKFGTIDMSEEFMVTEEIKVQARVKALHRMTDCLRNICSNEFAINKAKDKGELTVYRKVLDENIPKLISLCSGTQSHRVNGNFKTVLCIDENAFDIVFRVLWNVRNNITPILNRSGLIFAPQDFKSIEDYKRELEDRIINRG